jgi:thiol-disulfide isomerase/thioredoxin
MATARKATAKKGGGLSASQLILGGGIVLLLVGALAIALLGGGDDEDLTPAPGDEQTREVTVTGDALPPAPEQGAPDIGIGLPAPALAGQSFSGGNVTVDPASGKQLVMFVTHWCPVCQREVPKVISWLDDGGNTSGVKITLVSTGYDPGRLGGPTREPSVWLSSLGWPTPVIADSADFAAASAYGLRSYPYFVLLGDDGSVVSRISGELSMGDLSAFIAQEGAVEGGESSDAADQG